VAERPGVSGDGAGRPVKTLRVTLRPCLAESISHWFRVFYFRSQSGNLAMLAAIRRASSLLRSLAAESPARLFLEIDVSKLLAVVVAHDKARLLLFDRPGRRQAAFCHGVLSRCYGESPAKGIVGTTLCTLSIISRLAFCSPACFWREPRFCIKHHD
jgi:hypothetical protein